MYGSARKALLRNKKLSEHNKEWKFSIAVSRSMHMLKRRKKYTHSLVFNQYSFELDAVRVVASKKKIKNYCGDFWNFFRGKKQNLSMKISKEWIFYLSGA
jgi:DUF1365 family protein